MPLNEFDQPVGVQLDGWSGAKPPKRDPFEGSRVRIEAVDPLAHAGPLSEAYDIDTDGRNWTYLPLERPEGAFATKSWLETLAASLDPLFFTIVNKHESRPVGVASFLRIDPPNGVIEVGYISFSPLMQRTPVATEAMYLMMKRVFDDWGYRRYEWKCDALNAPSMAAAKRLGFTYEGTFRQATVTKGRNRDTAWFSILDSEWPAQKMRFQAWLSESNFDGSGNQITRLSDINP